MAYLKNLRSLKVDWHILHSKKLADDGEADWELWGASSLSSVVKDLKELSYGEEDTQDSGDLGYCALGRYSFKYKDGPVWEGDAATA